MKYFYFKLTHLLPYYLDIRRRIELIQDFSMPGLSTSVQMTRDNQYILATGIYKPRVRCYEVNNLSMKFERCFDSEVITFQAISEDYTKVSIVLLSALFNKELVKCIIFLKFDGFALGFNYFFALI